MTRFGRALVGVTLTIVAIARPALCADTVQLSLRDGRLSLVAVNSTPAQIFDAWSRAGGVRIVNAERMPSTPLTLTIENVPEEQALDTVLRAVTGYMARRRTQPGPGASIFDCIIILPSIAEARPAAAPTPAPAAGRGRSAAAPPPVAAPAPAPPPTFPQSPGVGRIIGPDGQPMEDDQAGAPPPPFNGGDAAAPRVPPPTQPRVVPSAPAPPSAQPDAPAQGTTQPGVSSAPGVPQGGVTSAPAGVPRPGMPVPAPAAPQQPR